jgi:hypothetical protein
MVALRPQPSQGGTVKINEMLQTQIPPPQTAPGITADALIEQLRSVNSQIPVVAP